ncbi:MAG: hypothetical protein AABY07_08235 [Nanoarchaeota archaeon]
MIELGGNIKLDGFNSVDPPTIIVVKKMIGNYAKKISDNITQVDELLIDLKESDMENKIFRLNATLTSEEEKFDSEVQDINLFFALDRAMQEIMKKAQK